jgi:hypothetical protein
MNHIKPTKEAFPKPILFSLWLLAGAIMFKSFNQLDSDYDLFWHLLIGKDILTKGMIERFDIYSFTAFGQPVFNHEWLSEVIMAGWYTLYGEPGMIVFRWIMSGLIIGLGMNLIFLLSKTPLNRIIVFLCFVLVLRPGISFRVQLFSMVFLLLLLNAIYLASKRDRLPSTVGISLLFLLWANLHGAFVLGLLVWFIYVGDYWMKGGFSSGIKGTIFKAILPALATLVNPYGPGLFGFIATELLNPISSVYISEWQRFSFEARELAFFLVCVMCWGAFAVSEREKKLSETLILILATLMGVMAVRNTPLFVILCLPLMTTHFDGAIMRLNTLSQKGKPLPGGLIYLAAGLFTGLSVWFIILGIPDKWEMDMEKNPLPVRLVHFLKVNEIKGNLFVPLHWGGYALFHLYPNIRVSIDGRWSMVYPREVMEDTMTFAYEGQNKKWKECLRKYDADFALVEPGNPALGEMVHDPEWTIVVSYTEGCILAKKGRLPSIRIDRLFHPKT